MDQDREPEPYPEVPCNCIIPGWNDCNQLGWPRGCYWIGKGSIHDKAVMFYGVREPCQAGNSLKT